MGRDVEVRGVAATRHGTVVAATMRRHGRIWVLAALDAEPMMNGDDAVLDADDIPAAVDYARAALHDRRLWLAAGDGPLIVEQLRSAYRDIDGQHRIGVAARAVLAALAAGERARLDGWLAQQGSERT